MDTPQYPNPTEQSPTPPRGQKLRHSGLRLWAVAIVLFAAGSFIMASDAGDNAPAFIGGLVWLAACLFAARAIFRGLLAFLRWLRHKPANPPSTAKPPRRRPGRALVWLFILALLIIGSVVYGPISDYYVLKDADPAMVTLAQKAGMNRKGELIFLRTHPRLDNDTQLEADCSSNAAANNSNGFIEQGCYDPGSNRIYIRKMPNDLADLEFTTAAYEVLHPIYISLYNGGDGVALNKSIESSYTSLNDPGLNDQVANFAKTEPKARDLELFSLLGTEYPALPFGLQQYYSPYFDNLAVNVTANNQIHAQFQSDQARLSQIDGMIKADDAAANKAYANSVSWARAGNQAEDNADYNIYRQDLANENSAIEQYNTLLETYNKLVTEYNGSQPVDQIQSASQ